MSRYQSDSDDKSYLASRHRHFVKWLKAHSGATKLDAEYKGFIGVINHFYEGSFNYAKKEVVGTDYVRGTDGKSPAERKKAASKKGKRSKKTTRTTDAERKKMKIEFDKWLKRNPDVMYRDAIRDYRKVLRYYYSSSLKRAKRENGIGEEHIRSRGWGSGFF